MDPSGCVEPFSSSDISMSALESSALIASRESSSDSPGGLVVNILAFLMSGISLSPMSSHFLAECAPHIVAVMPERGILPISCILAWDQGYQHIFYSPALAWSYFKDLLGPVDSLHLYSLLHFINLQNFL